MITCVLCRALFFKPTTISCGHTFCRKCLERDRPKVGEGLTCKECRIVQPVPTTLRTNVVLSNLIKKWFPGRSKAAELKSEGNKYFERRDFQRAITLYSEAITYNDSDHFLFSNRSHAYTSLQQFNKALDDAEKVVTMRPDWPKGFFRKGNALYELGHYEEAAIAFLQCLALDSTIALVKENLSKSLQMILTRQSPEGSQSAERQRELDAGKFQALVDSGFDLDVLQPHLPMDTWGQLQQVMEEVVVDGSLSARSCLSSSSSASSPAGVAEDSGFESSAMETDPAEFTGSVEGKQRCLDHIPMGQGKTCQQQHSRSLPLEGRCKDQESNDGHHSNLPLQPNASHLSPQKSSEAKVTAAAAAALEEVDPSLLNVEDLECSLCYRLFYQPVTTPCGHTFCRECLDRCLDHHTSCPICKSCLAVYLAERRSAVTESLQAIITTYFHREHLERQQTSEEEMSELARMGLDRQHDIPVFVCTLGFPTILCPLHVFEPRYRLMIRQCMESGTRQFGMCACLGETEEEFSEYGCMLEVRDVHFFLDGRSLVDTVGGRRFRVLSRGKRDGYNTAKGEFLQDDPISEGELAEIQSEQEEIYRSTETWLAALPPFHQARITQHFGPLPALDWNPTTSANGPAWAWWCIAVLPLDPHVQLSLLAAVSYRERLKTLKQVLGQLGPRLH